jgi:hypothetical protein
MDHVQDKSLASEADIQAFLESVDHQPFDEMWANLVWQPIAEYEIRQGNEGHYVILRGSSERWAFGYYDDSGWLGPCGWREQCFGRSGTLLEFEPEEWAAVSEDWAYRLAT